ncbi:UPF0481 protein At3g47200-like [Tripterygium wilfordii]|uniref:UPF0481 protein At3g47200-like n=1 Tax=Tripterygium wilfordii TaxID=458696 RepID=UPI0018F81822|nr:UPF0481 protein At3g47200-like [Tripterygium wilfordii]
MRRQSSIRGQSSDAMAVNVQFKVSSSIEVDEVTIDVDSLASSLHKLMPQSLSVSQQCSIFKIPGILKRHNPEAYVPNAFSIGPWHHDQKNLKPAEEIKLNYLQRLISRSRSPEKRLKEFIEAIAKVEKDVRAHYAEPIDMSIEDFVKLLVIDGCFIIELFRKHSDEKLRDEYDPIFDMSCMLEYLFHDLILLENQIP